MKTNRDLDLLVYRQITINDIYKIKWSPSGEYTLVLSNKGKTFSIYNSEFKSIFSKSLLIANYIDAIWAPNSSYFITYTSDTVYLFNFLNMSFKSWTDFQGNIIELIISENSNFIFVFTDHEDCPMYVAYNMIEDLYSSAYYDSYNNISQYYLQTEFKISYKIYSLSQLENMTITKARLNGLNNRLVIQYKDLKGRSQLKIFDIFLSKSVHDIKINFLFTMNSFRDMLPTDFELYYNYYRRSDLLLTLWDDRYLSHTHFNAYDLNISNN